MKTLKEGKTPLSGIQQSTSKDVVTRYKKENTRPKFRAQERLLLAIEELIEPGAKNRAICLPHKIGSSEVPGLVTRSIVDSYEDVIGVEKERAIFGRLEEENSNFGIRLVRGEFAHWLDTLGKIGINPNIILFDGMNTLETFVNGGIAESIFKAADRQETAGRKIISFTACLGRIDSGIVPKLKKQFKKLAKSFGFSVKNIHDGEFYDYKQEGKSSPMTMVLFYKDGQKRKYAKSVPEKKKGERKTRTSRISKTKLNIIKKHSGIKSSVEISKMIGVAQSTVSRHQRMNGWKRKPKSGA